MKIRKGNFETMALAIVTFMLVGVIATLSQNMMVDVNGVIRSESVELTATRIERSAFALTAFEDMKHQMDFGRRYRLYTEDRTDYVTFTFNGEEKVHPIDSNINYEIIEPAEENPSRFFCFNKTSGSETVGIYAGRC